MLLAVVSALLGCGAAGDFDARRSEGDASLVGDATAGPRVAEAALRLAAAEPELVRRLRGAPDAFRRDASGVGSPCWRLRERAATRQVCARLPERASAPHLVGDGQSPRLTLSLTPEGAAASAAEIEQGLTSYADVWPSTDVVWSSEASRLEAFLVIRGAEAPSEFVWNVALPEGLPLAWKEPSGAIAFGDERGTARLRMPKAFAIDARGVRRDGEVSYEAGRLTLRLDRRGLELPVLLDPAFELALWEDRTPQPGPRSALAMAFDSARGRTVLFGGSNNGSTYFPNTWEWDGTSWLLRAKVGPAARMGHALAYDSARKRTVLFGGSTASGTLADTWEWDGTTWLQRATTGPTARFLHAMVYDGARGRTVLFGGNGATDTSDTWEWDGTTWSLRSSSGPAARSGHMLAFDSVRARTVLFGGRSSTGSLTDTWEWNGTAWTQRATSGPPGTDGMSMTFDAPRGRTVLFGGLGNVSTWEWDGTSWTRQATAGPDGSYRAALVYDAARSTTLLFGGSDGASPYGDLWAWDGASWALRSSTGPVGESGHAVAYDSARHRTVLFGGSTSGSKLLGATWEWDGATWTRAAISGPAPRSGLALAYDAARGRTLLFGGLAGTTRLGDTWEWDGVTWVQRSTTGPSARAGAKMVYDSARARVVLFGGTTPSYSAETWEWDGATWALRATTGPSARGGTSLSYDARRRRCVLFGGYAGGFVADTWEWDGTTWTSRATTGPSARELHAATYDAARGRTVIFGGLAASGNPTDTWEWDGTTWTQTASAGPTTGYYEMAFDAARGRSVLVGYGATWEYHTAGGACACATGTACASPACDTGFCVDGVCCEGASLATTSPPACATCQACDTAASPGTCAGLTKTFDPDSCPSGNYCDAAGACVAEQAVGTACTYQAQCGTCLDCVSGSCQVVAGADDLETCTGASTCDAAGACKAKNGRACATGAECASGHCADGNCCESACTGGCDACDATPGSCTLAPAGAPGASPSCGAYACDGLHAACPTTCSSDAGCAAGRYCDATGSCVLQRAVGATCDTRIGADCQVAGCRACASGFCVGHVCCSTPCSGPCDTCLAPGGTCAQLAKGSVGEPTCAPYLCPGGSETCASGCASDAECAATGYCDPSGRCRVQQPNGAACSRARMCASVNCVDGVCCDGPCTGKCEACDATGTCAPVVGAPRGGRGTCAGTGPCAGACDGVVRDVCAYPGTGTTCAPASCTDATHALSSAGCDGRGACLAPSPHDCGRYACDASTSSCKVACTGVGDCASGFACAAGACQKAALGASCTLNAQCDAGHCVEGICCEAASCEAPSRCTVPGALGRCTRPRGAACSAASECGSGFCADGVCCDAACAGRCQACDLSGAVGTCTAVIGDPHSGRAPCGGDAACAGACDGVDVAACTFPSGQECSAACTSAQQTIGQCSALGECRAGAPQGCNGFACEGAVRCKTACAAQADCAPGFTCSGAKCKPDLDTCTADEASYVDPRGSVVSCAPIRCRAGACLPRCADSTDCLADFRCNADGACVPASSAAESGGGCSVGARDGGSAPPSLGGLGAVGLVIFIRARRRARRARAARSPS